MSKNYSFLTSSAGLERPDLALIERITTRRL